MYESLIRECLARAGRLGTYDPRHIEAWMRLEHSTLDGLAPEAFASEVLWATRCVDRDGVTRSELLAGSLGLSPAGRAA